jgi:hypothetical protein
LLGPGFACSGERGRIGNRTMLQNTELLSRWRPLGVDTERLTTPVWPFQTASRLPSSIFAQLICSGVCCS